MTEAKQKAQDNATFEAECRDQRMIESTGFEVTYSMPNSPLFSPGMGLTGMIIPIACQKLGRTEGIEVFCSIRSGAQLVVLFNKNLNGVKLLPKGGPIGNERVNRTKRGNKNRVLPR